ncbi:sugar phosphate isomerase/epimerase family protein [Alkalihalobacillus trypoxylicola]|uniref:Xylose isomerase n=1 Tax=Alkalihalobacillus trypoxylicola TaxID=519424 RepID=A0A162DFY0_9BACI|nr:sugar phosphate isomerase/epimerase family protein [Alkalihalobacillus trypoxylicola]KYG29500.1 xylose isomerase [Alkalihalobacillus trypoxylicola]
MNQFVWSAFADEIDEDLTIQMDVLESHGIKHIEMRGVNGRNFVSYSLEEVKEIKKKLDGRGFKLSAIGSPIGKISITDDFKPHLDLFKHTIEIAAIMGCQYIRMFSFFIPADENPDRYKDEVVSRWKQFLEVAKGRGIILLHENEKGIFGDTPERCLELMKALQSERVSLIFDFANFVQCDVEVFPHAYELLKEEISYIHVKDALYENHKVVPAGEGDGKLKEVLSELAQDGYEGFLSLEPHLWGFKGFEDLEPNSPAVNLPEGDQRNFAVAVQALGNILKEIKS